MEKKILFGEQVQVGGWDNFRSTVPPSLFTHQLETLSIVICPAPLVFGIGFYKKNIYALTLAEVNTIKTVYDIKKNFMVSSGGVIYFWCCL